MNKLEKARIYLTKKPRDVFYVQFNPNTLRYSVGPNSGHETHGSEGVPAQDDATGQSGSSRLSMTLFFYTFRSETDFDDVRKDINKLRSYLKLQKENQKIMSESITFAWGKITMQGHMESLEVSYQMFASDGTPVQAEVQVTIVGEDKDVTAAGINHAKADQIEKEAEAVWDQKKNSSDPADSDPDIAWLFEGV